MNKLWYNFSYYRNLMDNYISQFPMELTRMKNLVEMYYIYILLLLLLFYNRYVLILLIKQIYNNRNLSYNDIIAIPPSIKNLVNLEKL